MLDAEDLGQGHVHVGSNRCVCGRSAGLLRQLMGCSPDLVAQVVQVARYPACRYKLERRAEQTGNKLCSGEAPKIVPQQPVNRCLDVAAHIDRWPGSLHVCKILSAGWVCQRTTSSVQRQSGLCSAMQCAHTAAAGARAVASCLT